MKQELNEPVEMVLYNSHLGCYVSAMTVPCTQTGDARTSYWIHAVMPDEKESDGFMDCLSWPLQDYVTEVHLAQHLSPVTVRTETCDLSAICRKYHLLNTIIPFMTLWVFTLDFFRISKVEKLIHC